MPEHTAFSAQVVLDLPAEDGAARAQRAFVGLGFETGYWLGNSFAITGKAADFRSTFGVALALRPDGGVNVDGARQAPNGLPLQGLPQSLRPLVQAVVFSEPPAFGPGAP
jgi:hypothetical protein